jgi:hypothetical protein
MSFDLGVLVLHKEKMVGTALPNLADSATYQKPVLELDI